MKAPKIVLLIFFLTLVIPIFGQDNMAVPQRTPEQEAVKQTERLQQELNLTTEQTKRIYEINLHYARERQISNKRSEAMERMKNKNNEIQQVLNQEQNERLQTKRYERTNIEAQNMNHTIPINSSGFRSSSEFRINFKNLNQRNNNRPVNPNFQYRTQPNQSIRRGGGAPVFRPMRSLNNPTTTRSSLKGSHNISRGTGVAPIPPVNSATRQQSAPTRQLDTPNTNRK